VPLPSIVTRGRRLAPMPPVVVVGRCRSWVVDNTTPTVTRKSSAPPFMLERNTNGESDSEAESDNDEAASSSPQLSATARSHSLDQAENGVDAVVCLEPTAWQKLMQPQQWPHGSGTPPGWCPASRSLGALPSAGSWMGASDQQQGLQPVLGIARCESASARMAAQAR